MKLRRVEDQEPRPVKREELKPGDLIERHGSPCVICPLHFAEALPSCNTGIAAAHIGRDGWSDLSDDSPSFRIRITRQDADGKLTWKRILAQPKSVTLEELKPEGLFEVNNELYVRSQDGGAYRFSKARDMLPTFWQFRDCPLYRAEIVGFEHGVLLWRRVTG